MSSTTPTTPMSPAAKAHCPLCEAIGEQQVWADAQWRVIRVVDAAFPAFYRVIAQSHVAEFSELDAVARARCMALVAAVEQVLVSALAPTKINLAALGNMVPHLHWHVIARFDWDSHFPQPIWGPQQRELASPAVARLAIGLAVLDQRVQQALLALDT